MAALLFTSARPILGHFLLISYGFSSKLPGMANFSLKIVIFFVILNASLLFWYKILSGGGGATCNFPSILADFHEYILNMTYHVTEAINGYF